ncbi:MAG TPA: metalloregulator ArsR/SmtB family transcription factor [Limnochordia bacterium]|nr:metalloregulator ArsR/SmtB family transcription factor [Limnochordia bacterium]
MTDVVKLFKALGDENRLRILAALAKETYCVCDLARLLNIPQPTLSHHLKILRDIGLVKGEKDGQWIYCSLNSELLAEYGLDIDRLLAALEREAAPRV